MSNIKSLNKTLLHEVNSIKNEQINNYEEENNKEVHFFEENLETDEENIEIDEENLETDEENLETDEENIKIDEENIEIDEENIEIDEENLETDEKNFEDEKEIIKNEKKNIFNFQFFESNHDYYETEFIDYFQKINVINTTIHNDNVRIFEKHLNNLASSSYFGGLFDGDGSFGITKANKNDDGYTSSFSMSQSRTNILQILKYHFGGIIGLGKKKEIKNILNDDKIFDKLNCRINYSYRNTNPNKFYFINYIKNGIIIKEKEVDCLLELKQYIKRPGYNEERTNIFNKMKQFKENRINTEVNFEKLNLDYIAGLFDAEGFCYLSKKHDTNKYTRSVYMKITQKNYPKIIEQIQKFMGFGKVDNCGYIYYVSGAEDCMKFIKLIENCLIIKYNEVQILKNYIETMNYTNEKGYDNKIHYYRHYLAYLMSKEKHENEEFDLNYNLDNIYSFDKYINIIKKEEIEIENKKKIENKINLNKILSEKKKGANNPNYGKVRTEERNKKSADSISRRAREKNLSLSDDNIMNVLRKLKDGESMYRIFENHKAENKSLTRDKIKEMKEGTFKPLFVLDNDVSKQDLINEYEQLINDLK